MPQFSFNQERFINGQLANTTVRTVDTLTNELFAQVSSADVGATPSDGNYTIRVVGIEGTFDIGPFVASTSTEDEIADGLNALAAADPDLLNILSVPIVPAGDPLVLTFLHPGRVYTVTWFEDADGASTITTTTAAGGTNVPLGVFIVQGSADNLGSAPNGSSVDDDVIGISYRNVGTNINPGSTDATLVDIVAPGREFSLVRQGVVAVNVEDAVAKNADVFMRITAGVNGTVLGALRSDVDGGEAIEITGARFDSTTTGAGIAEVKINRP